MTSTTLQGVAVAVLASICLLGYFAAMTTGIYLAASATYTSTRARAPLVVAVIAAIASVPVALIGAWLAAVGIAVAHSKSPRVWWLVASVAWLSVCLFAMILATSSATTPSTATTLATVLGILPWGATAAVTCIAAVRRGFAVRDLVIPKALAISSLVMLALILPHPA